VWDNTSDAWARGPLSCRMHQTENAHSLAGPHQGSIENLALKPRITALWTCEFLRWGVLRMYIILVPCSAFEKVWASARPKIRTVYKKWLAMADHKLRAVF
jgi:hypothetical protein